MTKLPYLDSVATRERNAFESTQQPNPGLPNSKKTLIVQSDSLLVATPAGFEPATFSLEGCCSIP
jgi:hypothetical protein